MEAVLSGRTVHPIDVWVIQTLSDACFRTLSDEGAQACVTLGRQTLLLELCALLKTQAKVGIRFRIAPSVGNHSRSMKLAEAGDAASTALRSSSSRAARSSSVTFATVLGFYRDSRCVRCALGESLKPSRFGLHASARSLTVGCRDRRRASCSPTGRVTAARSFL